MILKKHRHCRCFFYYMKNSLKTLKNNNTNRVWYPGEKYKLVAKVIAGSSLTDIVLKEGIDPGMLNQSVQKHKTMGYNELAGMKKADRQRSPS